MPQRQWRSFAWCSRQSEALLRKMDSEGSAHDVCSDAYGGVYPRRTSQKITPMLYMLIAISFISTIALLGLDAFRVTLMQTRIKHYYRKLVDAAFVLTIASIVLTSLIGFVQKGNAATATAQQVAEK